MQLTGKIIAAQPIREGVSAKGNNWQSATYVIEVANGNYTKKIAFDVLNDKIKEFNIQIGETITVSFDIDAHEYNGRWYNGINAWNVTRQTQTGGGKEGSSNAANQAKDDSLPF